MLCNFIQVREHISLLLYYGRLPIGKKKCQFRKIDTPWHGYASICCCAKMAVLTVLYCAVISWRLSKPFWNVRLRSRQQVSRWRRFLQPEVGQLIEGKSHRIRLQLVTMSYTLNTFVQHLCNAHPLRNQRTHRTQFVPRQFSGATGACGGLGSCPGGRAGGCGRPFANDCLRLTRLQTVQWNSVGRGDSSGDH